MLMKPLAAWGMESALAFTRQSWFTLVFVSIALFTLFSLRTIEIVIFVFDIVGCILCQMYSSYADHSHLDKLFWHIKRELVLQGMLDLSDIAKSDGQRAAAYMWYLVNVAPHFCVSCRSCCCFSASSTICTCKQHKSVPKSKNIGLTSNEKDNKKHTSIEMVTMNPSSASVYGETEEAAEIKSLLGGKDNI